MKVSPASILKQTLSITLIWLLIVLSPATTAANAQSAPQTSIQKPTVREQILKILEYSWLQVELKSKEKLRGQLRSVTEQGFTLTAWKGTTPEDKNVLFDQVKSVKPIDINRRSWWQSPWWWALSIPLLILILLAKATSDGQ